MSLGTLGPDGKSCIYRGLPVPIGPHFSWNKAKTRLCNDEDLTDCFLYRSSARADWEPVHPLLVQNDCFAYWQGQPWMRVGTPTPDGQGCQNQGHVIPVGHELKQDRHHDSYYCYDEPDKAQNQTQKKWCLERPDKPQSTSGYLMRRWAGGIDNSVAALKKGDDKVRQGIDEMAAGTPLHATTPAREAEAVGQKILSTARNATREDAKHAAQGVLDATAAWLKKPWQQKLGDAVESVGDAMASPTTYVPAVGILRTGGKLADAVEHTAEAAGAVGKRGAKAEAKRSSKAAAGEVAEHTDEAVARRLLKEAREAEGRRLDDAVSHTPAKPPHANKVDDRPATLYKKLDEEKRLQKWGVTRHEDPNRRYTRKEIAGGEVRRLERGPRREMLQKERELVETNPGPDNREPWAGKRRQ